MAEGADLGAMVRMIMDNPTLMAELTQMAKSSDGEEEKNEIEAVPTASIGNVTEERMGRRERRHRLMGAIREYLSEPRAKAVDTMMSIFDILDLAGGR